MKNISIPIIAACILVVLLHSTNSVYAASFTDVPTNSWYQSIVQKFKDAGYLHRDGSRFRPADAATRAEFVQLILDAQGGIRQAPPAVPSFTDVQADQWYYVYMEEAGRLQWVKGDGNCYGRLPCIGRPNSSVNRAEAAALLMRAFGFESIGSAPYFTDNNASAWYGPIIQIAADHCILQGDDATKRVRPADTMNRAEMVAMVDRARQRLTYGLDCGQQQSIVPRIESVTALSADTIVIDFTMALNPGSVPDTLRYSLSNTPDMLVIRATLVRSKGIELQFNKPLVAGKRYSVAIKNMLTSGGLSFADSASFTALAQAPVADGTLQVRASSSGILGQSLPKGAQRLPLLSVDFTASCDGSISLTGIDVVREGKGNRSDISGVYALLNGERITRKRTLEANNNTVSLHFKRPIIVQACKTITVDIAVDFSATAETSAQHSLAVRSASTVDSNAKNTQGTFPITSAVFTVATTKTGTITVEYRSVTPKEVRVGEKSRTISRMQISTDSTEDQKLQSILLEQDGSVKTGDLENIRIQKSDGTVLTSTVKKLESDYVYLTFSPALLVRQGDRITLDVLADIVGGAGRTIQIGLEESADLFAVGTISGKSSTIAKAFGSRVSIPTTTEADIVAIDAGGFIVEVDGPSQQTFAPDDRNARLANVVLTSGAEAANIRKMYILVQAQTQAGAGFGSGSGQDDEVNEVLRNVRLRNTVTGKTISSVLLTGINDRSTSAQKTYQIYRFDDFVVRGKQFFDLQVDFVNNGQDRHPKSGDKFRIFICGEPTHIRNSNSALTTNTLGCDFGGVLSSKSTAYQMQVEGLSTGDRIADVRPRGTIAGNFHSIANAALTIAVSSMGDNDIVVRNSTNVPLLRFEARAGSSRDILLTKLSFDAQAGSLLNGQNYSLWADTNNDSIVDVMLQTGVSTQSATVTFNKLLGNAATVMAGKSRMYEVRSAISSSPPSSTLQLKFAHATSNYIEAEQVNGSTLSGIRTNGSCSSNTCDVSVSTVNSTVYTIGQQGNLYITKSTTPIRARQLLGGTVSDSILRLTFRADNEPIDVTSIRIVSSGSTASSVEKLELYADNALQPFASATAAGCGSITGISSHNGIAVQTFCASMRNRQLVIPAGKNVEVHVRAKMKTDTGGGTSGQQIQLWIPASQFGNESAIQGYGTASSTDLTFNDDDSSAEGEVFIGRSSAGANAVIAGGKNISTLAKISSITNASPDTNGSAIPTGISDIAQFRFATAAQSNSKNGTNTFVLNKLLFTVNATNVQVDADAFSVVNKEETNIEHVCTALDSVGNTITGATTGTFYVSCIHMQSASISTDIEQNSSTVLIVRSTILNPSIANKTSTLQVSMQSFSSSSQSAFGVGSSAIEWKDTDSGGSTTFLWVDLQETTVNSTSYRN